MLQHTHNLTKAEQQKRLLRMRQQRSRKARKIQGRMHDSVLPSAQSERLPQTNLTKVSDATGATSGSLKGAPLPRQNLASSLQPRPKGRRTASPRSLRPKTQPIFASQILGSCCRLGFFGLGISALVGTALAALHPQPPVGTLAESIPESQDQTTAAVTAVQNSDPALAQSFATTAILAPGKRMTDLEQQIKALAAEQEGLTAGLFFYSPDTGAYVDIGGEQAVSAASTIKLPVLIAFFQDVDAGKIKLDESLVMRKDLIASESGVMQYQPPGTAFSALETADKMITISDNTATNMLIDRLGGIAALNQRFKRWGLAQTVLRNPLPDLEGTNTITPKDLSGLLLKVNQGELLSAPSRDRALKILSNTVTDTLLPQGLEPDATIEHKTGDIGSVVGDTGIVNMPNGQRYVATVMVQRPHNDPRAQELIRQISKLTYGAFRDGSKDDSSSGSATVSALTN